MGATQRQGQLSSEVNWIFLGYIGRFGLAGAPFWEPFLHPNRRRRIDICDPKNSLPGCEIEDLQSGLVAVPCCVLRRAGATRRHLTEPKVERFEVHNHQLLDYRALTMAPGKF